jgi:hypothetical protein
MLLGLDYLQIENKLMIVNYLTVPSAFFMNHPGSLDYSREILGE